MTKNKFAGLVAATQAQAQTPEPEPTSAPVSMTAPAARASAAQGEATRMFGGRVPESIFREFQVQKMQAEGTLGVRRVTTEEGLEAFVRMLRRPDLLEAWHQTLSEVRQDRRN